MWQIEWSCDRWRHVTRYGWAALRSPGGGCSLRLLFWSPRLGWESITFCRWLCLSVCLSVCLSRCSFKSILLFCLYRAIFWPSVLHVALYKTVFFVFWFRSPNAHNLQLHKMPISRACMTDRPEMFGPTRGFSGMANSMEPLWGRPLSGASTPLKHGRSLRPWKNEGGTKIMHIFVKIVGGGKKN